MEDRRADAAAFYWLALSDRLLPAEVPVAWADDLIAAADGPADVKVIDLSLSAGRPADRVLDALRAFMPDTDRPRFSPEACRMYAALLWRLIHDGRLSEAAAARLLYGLHLRTGGDADEVLGREIRCIDEHFEPWSLGPKDAPAAVRKFLRPFASEPLPLPEARGGAARTDA